jgi:hypothetical protein
MADREPTDPSRASKADDDREQGAGYEAPTIEPMGTMHELTEAMAFATLDISAQLGSSSSDVSRKENIAPVDTKDILAKVGELAMHRWNYISDGASIQHIGPTAQDFYAAFAVGEDDHHIHPIDGYGVALAAVQELTAEVDRLRAEVEELRGARAAEPVA